MNPDRAWAGLRLADDAVTVRELLSHPGGVDSYAVLGQLIADLTGTSFAQAATRLVLEPLGMADSWFPAQAPVSPTPFDRLILTDVHFRRTAWTRHYMTP